MCSEGEADSWRHEMRNTQELQELAHLCPEGKAVDWSVEVLSEVRIDAVSEDGLVLAEVICSDADQHCIAVEVPVAWPDGLRPRIDDSRSLRTAFAALAARLHAANEDAMPVRYQQQQELLDNAMHMVPPHVTHTPVAHRFLPCFSPGCTRCVCADEYPVWAAPQAIRHAARPPRAGSDRAGAEGAHDATHI